MKHTFHILVGSLMAALSACGPMVQPMPVRFQADEQQQIDDSWNSALEPIDRLDDQTLLDALLVSTAYQSGVDRLYFRSEKQCSVGLVVMESHFDRSQPDLDSFSVTVHDHPNRALRRVVYTREDVERTYRQLFVEPGELRRKGEFLTEQDRANLAASEDRLAKCNALFPRFLQNGQ